MPDMNDNFKEADFTKDEFQYFHDPEFEDDRDDDSLFEKLKNMIEEDRQKRENDIAEPDTPEPFTEDKAETDKEADSKKYAKEPEKIGKIKEENDTLWKKLKNVFRKIADTIKTVFHNITEPSLLYARLAGGKELANKIYDANIAEQARQAAIEKEKANQKIPEEELETPKKDKEPDKNVKQQDYQPVYISELLGNNYESHGKTDNDNKQAKDLLIITEHKVANYREDIKNSYNKIKNIDNEAPNADQEKQALRDDINVKYNAMIDEVKSCQNNLSAMDFTMTKEMKFSASTIDNLMGNTLYLIKTNEKVKETEKEEKDEKEPIGIRDKIDKLNEKEQDVENIILNELQQDAPEVTEADIADITTGDIEYMDDL